MSVFEGVDDGTSTPASDLRPTVPDAAAQARGPIRERVHDRSVDVETQQLTDGQIRALGTVRAQWLAHGLATGPADRAEAERGAAEAYRAAGLKPPGLFIWLDSPLAGAIAAWLLTPAAQVGAQVRVRFGEQAGRRVCEQVFDQIRARARGQIEARVRDQARIRIGVQVGERVGDQVRRQVSDQIWHQDPDRIWDQIRAQIQDQIQDQIRVRIRAKVRARNGDHVGDQVSRAVAGQHGTDWLAYYDFLGTHCGLAEAGRLAGMMRVARSAGWWWPFEDAVILTERPTALHRDRQARLHCEDGPALVYPDGFAIWAWHGVRVPEDLIATGWDTARILRERNAEVRRCAIERLGWDRFIKDSGLTRVASCPDPGNPPHHLALYELSDELADLYHARARILLCVNGSEERDGTRRRFGLPVPAHHTDPVEAAADLYGWPAETYRQLEARR